MKRDRIKKKKDVLDSDEEDCSCLVCNKQYMEGGKKWIQCIEYKH